MWNIQSQLCTHGMCGPVDCGIVWSENVEGFIVAMSTVAMCTKSYLPIPIVCRIQVRWRAALQMVLASGIWLTMPDRKKSYKVSEKEKPETERYTETRHLNDKNRKHSYNIAYMFKVDIIQKKTIFSPLRNYHHFHYHFRWGVFFIVFFFVWLCNDFLMRSVQIVNVQHLNIFAIFCIFQSYIKSNVENPFFCKTIFCLGFPCFLESGSMATSSGCSFRNKILPF